MYNLKVVILILATLCSQVLTATPPKGSGDKPAGTRNVSGSAPAGTRSLSGEIAIHFPVNQSQLLKGFSGNANSLNLLDKLMNDYSFYYDIDSIVISGYASPEGAILHNSRLSFERARAVKEHITKNYHHVGSNKIFAVGKLVDMQAVSDILDNDLSVPFRNEALAVLATRGISEIEQLARLKDVGGGAVIAHITKYYASSMRNATGIMFYRASDRVAIVDTLIIEHYGDTVFINNPADTVVLNNPGDTVFVGNYERLRKPLFAVKTNLLFDLSTAVNAEIEVPVGRRLSVLAEYISPWWLIEERQYALQAVNANVELRYWLGNRYRYTTLTGFFTGAYYGLGYFDAEWGTMGYQGKIRSHAGMTFGYAHTLGRKGAWRLEYSLGAGYLNADYDEYKPLMGDDERWRLIRQRSGNYSWIGPTRFKISLVWLLHRNLLKPNMSNN